MVKYGLPRYFGMINITDKHTEIGRFVNIKEHLSMLKGINIVQVDSEEINKANDRTSNDISSWVEKDIKPFDRNAINVNTVGRSIATCDNTNGRVSTERKGSDE